MKETVINRRVGEEIRIIRLGKNLSQEAMADELNISVSTLSNLERGHTEFTISRLYDILTFLEIPVFDFFKRLHKEELNSSEISSEKTQFYSKTEHLEDEIRRIKSAIEELKNK